MDADLWPQSLFWAILAVSPLGDRRRTSGRQHVHLLGHERHPGRKTDLLPSICESFDVASRMHPRCIGQKGVLALFWAILSPFWLLTASLRYLEQLSRFGFRQTYMLEILNLGLPACCLLLLVAKNPSAP